MTQLPENLMIGGHRYTIKTLDMVNTEGNANLGEQHPSSCTIRINSKMAETQLWATLLHEIIEALNADYAMGLEHPQIQQLESALFQVLEVNFPGWRQTTGMYALEVPPGYTIEYVDGVTKVVKA